jgi:class 3 adenylate cyclase
MVNKPYLEWIDQQSQVQYNEIVDRIFIGRICQGIDAQKRIILDSPSASRDHAVIDRTASHLRVTDTSKNGTWVNGVRMTAGSAQDLADGDVIRIGEFSFRVFYPVHVSADRGLGSQTEMTIVTPAEMVVTNLIADVRKFTNFFQHHASADVFDVMKEIFDDFSAIVNEFKGTIKDYAGDAVYAFWEHQVESPQKQAALACQAAVRQMQHLDTIMAKLAGRHSGFDTINMGWGISTGSVTISHYGSRLADMALVGECINLASRLSDIANKELPEQIIICSQTAKLVRKDLVLKDLGEISIRGLQGKERVFTIA